MRTLVRSIDNRTGAAFVERLHENQREAFVSFDVVIISGGSAGLIAAGELTGMAGGSLVRER